MNASEYNMQEKMEAALKKQLSANEQPSADEHAYGELFQALNEKPAIGPSYAFSKNVIRRLQTEKNYKSSYRLNLVLPACIAVIVAVLYFVAAGFNNTMAHTVISQLWQFKWYLLIGIAVFYTIQYMDSQLIRKKINSNRH